jgi:hypothetical protein
MTRKYAVALAFALVILGAAATARAQSILYATGNPIPNDPTTRLFQVNPASGALTPIGSINFDWVGGLAVHPSTGRLYAISSGDFFSTLITLDPATGAGAPIGILTDPTGATCGGTLPCNPQFQDLAFRPDGTLVGSLGGGGYLTIDTATAIVTFVPLRFTFPYGMSPMTIGPDGFGYASWAEPNLLQIDLSTGEVNGPVIYIPETTCGQSFLFSFSTFAFEPGTGTLFATSVKGSRGDPFGSNPCLVILDRTDPANPFVTEIGLLGLPGSSTGPVTNPWITGLAFAAAPSNNNTLAGFNQSVTPVDAATGNTPVTLLFSEVLEAGTTTLSMQTSGPALPTGFNFAGTSTYYEITTTAVYKGAVRVCIDAAGLGAGLTPHLFHFASGAWVDVPVTPGASPSIVCGTVSSLSPFALLTPATVPDTVPPVIRRIVATPDELWPPRNQMVPVSIRVDVSDACDPHASCRIVSVSSHEEPERHEHDRVESDWQITGPLTLRLRAERSGHDRDRAYRIVVECSDASGNTARKTVVVTVPHDRGR